jgi:hypothetical protein
VLRGLRPGGPARRGLRRRDPGCGAPPTSTSTTPCGPRSCASATPRTCACRWAGRASP